MRSCMPEGSGKAMLLEALRMAPKVSDELSTIWMSVAMPTASHISAITSARATSLG